MITPLVIAHRGDAQHAPENTTDAFRAAWQNGADGIETDIRTTKDGVLVCHHDAACFDSDDRELVLSTVRDADLRAAHGIHLATLQDLLNITHEALDADTERLLMLEVKSDDAAVDAADVATLCVRTVQTFLQDHPMPTTIVVTAGDIMAWHAICIAIRNGRAANIVDGVTLYQTQMLRSYDRGTFQQHPPTVLSVPQTSVLSSAQRYAAVHRVAYTINQPKIARHVFRAGFAGIITDTVARMVSVRDRWSARYPDRVTTLP